MRQSYAGNPTGNYRGKKVRIVESGEEYGGEEGEVF